MADFFVGVLSKAVLALVEAVVARLVWQLWTARARNGGAAPAAPAAV